MAKYSNKVPVTLTDADYAKLEKMVEGSRLTIGQLASTLVEQGIAAATAPVTENE